MEAQDTVKKELTTHFPREEFSWINDIFLKDDEEEEERGQGGKKNNPSNPAAIGQNITTVDDNVVEAREEVTILLPYNCISSSLNEKYLFLFTIVCLIIFANF